MALYTYECEEKCGEMELRHPIDQDDLKVCPKCGSTKFKKIMKGGNFQFGCLGFYKNDYKYHGQNGEASYEKF